MKTLTSAAQTECGAFASQPALVLKIECGGSWGTLWYAERDLSEPVAAEGRIAGVAGFETVLPERKDPARNDVRVTLLDADLSLKELFDAGAFDSKPVTLYQHFLGLESGDLVALATGVAGKIEWREDGRELILAIGEIVRLFENRPVTRVATADDFPQIAARDEGRVLPLVYGNPHRVKAVLVQGGAETELALSTGSMSAEMIVTDASRFPSGTIKVRVGQEIIEGSFTGNTFAMTERGCAIESGTLSHTSGNHLIIRATSLSATEDNVYAGYFVRMTVGERLQYRRITQSVAETGALTLVRPFLDAHGKSTTPSIGDEFTIATLPSIHYAGEPVREFLDTYIYIVNDAPSVAVDAVEGFGVVEPRVVIGDEVVVSERRGEVTLPPQYYAVDANDSTSFPELGHAVTTVTVRRFPTDIPGTKFLENDLYVTLRGCKNAEEELLDNPASIIRDLLLNSAGLATSDLDETSFAAAAYARADVVMAFALDRLKSVSEAVHDLAFQARLALVWDADGVRLLPLNNAAGSAVAYFDDDALALESVNLIEDEQERAVTQITARYVHHGEAAAVTVSDPEAEALTGAHHQALSLWAFENRRQVAEAASWWLRRWKHRYRILEFETYLPGVPVEIHDTVSLAHPALFSVPVLGRVAAVTHHAGDKTKGDIDRVKLRVRLPWWGGCASSCEHDCETGGCESAGCELSCTAGCEAACEWACESNCEEACQLSCTLKCEFSCEATCQLSCRSEAETGDTSCESFCETGCEVSCESFGCESTCESCCECNCESASSETVSPVRQVNVVTAPTEQYGSLTVVQCDKSCEPYCQTFTAYDPFDVRPAAGETATVYLNFNFEWVVVPNAREAKYVRVLSDAGSGMYSVVEQDPAGATWGDAFYAWAVDSV
jgi:hypothetical protein